MTSGADPAERKTTEPPPEGSPIGAALEHYAGHGLRLVLLEGKSPQINGLGWQSRASDDLGEMLRQLGALGSKARRVTGIGMLQDGTVTLDADNLANLNVVLRAHMRGGWLNPSSPGKWHSTFRTTRPIGSSPVKFDAAFPPGGDGKWGQIKGVGSQVRIWGPGDHGTFCAHRLPDGPIPELPAVLDACGIEPSLVTGDPLSRAELDDWLNRHTESMAPHWLGRDLARFADDLGLDKHTRCLRRVWHLAHNAAAGAYPGWTAYNEGLAAYKAMCHAEGDWVEGNLRKYAHQWKAGVGKISTDPREIAEVEAKRARLLRGAGLDGIPWDPEGNPDHAYMAETFALMERAFGRVPRAEREITTDEIAAMLGAVDADA